MKRSLLPCLLALALAVPLPLALTGCGARALAAEDLMANVQPTAVDDAPAAPDDASAQAIADFSVRLLQADLAAGDADESRLVSPLSVLCALGMAANGADGETRSQMEGAFGLSVPELNASLHALVQALPAEECSVDLADSLWINRDALAVDDAFLQTNANWYGAGVYRAAFDGSTASDMNAWVGDRTHGIIPHIVDEAPPDAALYLANALAFEGVWHDEYEADQVRDGRFAKEDGTARSARLMYSTEHRYLEDDRAVGFVKSYRGGAYAFAALLPDEGVDVEDYLASLTGERLLELLGQPGRATVDAAIPKFESSYDTDLAGALAALGMRDAFDGDRADFSGIGSPKAGNVFVNRVLHKTFVSVDERGTKAAAATAMELNAAAAAPEPEEPKVVHLDRPFVYLIVDCRTNLPLFIGTVMDVG